MLQPTYICLQCIQPSYNFREKVYLAVAPESTRNYENRDIGMHILQTPLLNRQSAYNPSMNVAAWSRFLSTSL